MDFSVPEVSRLLSVPERRVLRWIKDGRLPAHRVHEQHRVNAVDLQEWAAEQNLRVHPEAVLGGGAATPAEALLPALRRGGVHHRVAGASLRGVLAAVVSLPGIPASVNRKNLLELLLARESLASTAVGGGIAIPHPRSPLVHEVTEPVLILAFTATPIDFAAPDERPVNALFVLLSPSIPSHLATLSRLAYMLHDEDLKRLLASAAPRESILERVGVLDAGFRSGEGAPSGNRG
jgi:PTS system nitrogen regulatory IIA component